MYRVVKFFTDLQDNNYAYNAGDVFPRNGFEVSEKRLIQLSTSANRRGEALIEEVTDEVKEPVADFMNPPIMDDTEEIKEDLAEDKPKKKRGRPKNAE